MITTFASQLTYLARYVGPRIHSFIYLPVKDYPVDSVHFSTSIVIQFILMFLMSSRSFIIRTYSSRDSIMTLAKSGCWSMIVVNSLVRVLESTQVNNLIPSSPATRVNQLLAVSNSSIKVDLNLSLLSFSSIFIRQPVRAYFIEFSINLFQNYAESSYLIYFSGWHIGSRLEILSIVGYPLFQASADSFRVCIRYLYHTYPRASYLLFHNRQ